MKMQQCWSKGGGVRESKSRKMLIEEQKQITEFKTKGVFCKERRVVEST